MGKPRVFRVKNWAKFQHYKYRKPPWIRLYKEILDDREFMDLPDASRALAPCLWLMASESDNGTIPADLETISWRLRKDVVWLTDALIPLLQHKFLEDASNVLAECKHDAPSEQSRVGRVKKEKKEKIPPTVPPKGTNGFSEFWEAYPRKVGKRAAERAWRRIKWSKELQQQILNSVAEHTYSPDWTRENGRFIPHPTTFLNQGRWDDELEPVRHSMTVEEIEARAQRGKPDYDSK